MKWLLIVSILLLAQTGRAESEEKNILRYNFQGDVPPSLLIEGKIIDEGGKRAAFFDGNSYVAAIIRINCDPGETLKIAVTAKTSANEATIGAKLYSKAKGKLTDVFTPGWGRPLLNNQYSIVSFTVPGEKITSSGTYELYLYRVDRKGDLFVNALSVTKKRSNNTGPVKTYVYPSLIYDSGKCSIYSDHLTSLLFMFFCRDKDKINDFASTSVLTVDLPEGLKLKNAGIMNGWKKSGGVFYEFPSVPVKHGDRAYLRYTVPLPQGVFMQALEKPLPGGMFGGACHNLTNISVKPEGKVPENFTIFWAIDGKYKSSGGFPAYTITLPGKQDLPKRIKLRSVGPLANMGNTPEYVKDLASIYRIIGVNWVDSQFAEGPNLGYPELWREKGFRFYGGSGFLHTLMKYSLQDRSSSPDMNDYLVGLDGKRAYGTPSLAYHGRIWCPTAVITPGRYPYQLNMDVAKQEALTGVSEIDADFEIHAWSHCFCPACLSEFAKFSKLDYDSLKVKTPVDIVRDYPVQWYKFRSEQTRRLYMLIEQYLDKNHPGIKIGANTVLESPEKDFAGMKYGFCAFGEDPRLLNDSVDYFLADTLTGSLADAVAVDVMRKTTTKPIISVAGCSYCVGFSPFCMAGRRMTGDMTGESYGYDRRGEFMTLGILHQIASGASGVRFDVDEPLIARHVADAAALLAKLEDWYLDGERADAQVEVFDLTAPPSPWNADESRIGGQIWKHFYRKYNGDVQYRVHLKDGGILISLFNWDPWQEKDWLVRLTPKTAADYEILDVVNSRILCLGSAEESIWKAVELGKGINVKVPPAGMRILLLDKKTRTENPVEVINVADRKKALSAAAGKQPYDQYGWYTGKEHDAKQMAENGIKRPFEELRKYGEPQKGNGKK